MKRIKISDAIKKTSVYKKVKLLFISIMLLIFIVGTTIYMQGRKLILNEISSAVSKQNKSMALNFQDENKKIRAMQYAFVGREDVLSLIIATEEEEKELLIREIQGSLAAIWKSDRFIEEASVIIPSYNLEINSGKSMGIRPQTETIIHKYELTNGKESLFYEGDLVVVSAQMGLYYVIVELSESAVSSYVIQNSQGGLGTYALYDTNNNQFFGNITAREKELITELVTQNNGEALYDKNDYLIHIMPVKNSSLLSVSFVPKQEVFADLNYLHAGYWILVLVIFLGQLVFLRLIFSMVDRPLKVLMSHLGEVAEGNLDKQIRYHSGDEFGTIYDRFNHITEHLKWQIDKNYKQEILLQKSELRQLQTQIAPHFLYNGFLTLRNSIQAENYEFAEDFSGLLGQYFLFITRNENQFITLKEELEHAGVYAQIQQARYKTRVRMQFDPIPEAIEQIKVPRLIVQPVFENIFKHVVDKQTGETFIHMSVRLQEDYLDIQIENSGARLREEDLIQIRTAMEDMEGEIHAMNNIHQRLKLIYPEKGGVLIEHGARGGLMVTLRIASAVSGEEENNVPNTAGG